VASFFENFWPLFVLVVSLLASTAATVHIVLNKRDPRAAIGWTALVWLSPFIGCGLYACFGINRIERKAISLRLQEQWQHPRYVPLEPDELQQQQEFAAVYPTFSAFGEMMEKLTDRAALPGNRVELLLDGDQAYPAMWQAIDQAEHTIALLSYIFDSDRAGLAFVERLRAAKKRDVEIRVLVDDVGSRYSRPTILKELQAAGITAATFLPTRVPRMFKYANLRNHRKILVVDGRIGFTGGTNIREGHWLELAPAAPVQCLHFRFQGPVVAQLQETFAFDWAFATGESIDGPLWFPPGDRAGDVWARGIASGPDEDHDKMVLAILGALTAARKKAYVITPYFLPDLAVQQSLSAAALRGVDVRILLPSKNNIALVDWASRPMMPYLLERGCRFFKSPAPFDHTKLFVVDGMWSLVGSTNWDPRSLRLNFEFNVECYSGELGSQLESHFLRRLDSSEEVLIESVRNQGLLNRVGEGVARLFSPYL
jgi:cardiolipin synthase